MENNSSNMNLWGQGQTWNQYPELLQDIISNAQSSTKKSQAIQRAEKCDLYTR